MNWTASWLALACVMFSSVAVALGFAQLPEPQRRLLASAQSVWTTLDADTQRQLQANAAHWLARTPAQRAELRRGMQRWDAMPAAERAHRRAVFAAWQALPATERQAVRAAATRFATLPREQQQTLRNTFAAMPVDSQRAWSLGPSLGRDALPLMPLFAFVTPEQRPAMLDLLRSLAPGARADLARLVPRLDENQRQRLRQRLLAAAPELRAQMIAEQLR